GHYQGMAAASRGLQEVAEGARSYFVAGMSQCAGGPGLDHFDLLGAMVDWVENGQAPTSVTASGKAFPGRSRPLCAYPRHAHYKGNGDIEDAANFECR